MGLFDRLKDICQKLIPVADPTADSKSGRELIRELGGIYQRLNRVTDPTAYSKLEQEVSEIRTILFRGEYDAKEEKELADRIDTIRENLNKLLQ